MHRFKMAADGNTEAFNLSGDPAHNVFVHGSDGGGTVKLQVSAGNGYDDATEKWFDVASASWTAEAQAVFTLPAGRYRFNLAGATGPTLVVGVSS